MTKKINKPQNGAKLTQNELRITIYRAIRKSPSTTFTPRSVLKILKISNNIQEVLQAMIQLSEEKKIREKSVENFVLQVNKTQIFLEGEVDLTKSGAAYIKVLGRLKDVYIPAKFTSNALDGDKVQISLDPKNKYGDGKILKIIQRARDSFMGGYFRRANQGFIKPFKGKEDFEIQLDGDFEKYCKPGDIIIVKVHEWPSKKSKYPIGQLIENLGQQDSSDVQMKSILVNAGFNLEFGEIALEEAAQLPSLISPNEIQKREDFRKVTTITIDPFNAKDFDDAISYKEIDEHHFQIGVHIADVSHYIEENSNLDKEAFERSTSVYLVDRVLPMLPEKISNELCSLRPNEDKLTFSAIFIFNKDFKIVKKWFGKTIIHSDRRFTYEEAQEIIELGTGDFSNELKLLNQVAKHLSKLRYENGSISFETDEVQFILDENGVPIEVFHKVRKDAHLLIEEFMLLANKSVAEFIQKKGKDQEIPYVYRIHDLPNTEKLADFAKFSKELGYHMDLSSPKSIAKSFNDLADLAEENSNFKLLAPLAIRTMAKAEYSTNNIGHYGLAFENYSHFTSPIRRYSDLLAHRILFENLSEKSFRVNKNDLDRKCAYISRQERKAMEAERESIKYKQVEFLSKYVGHIMFGVISGIIEKGVFVELNNIKCEGFVRFDRFKEAFELEEGRLKAMGKKTGRILKMGDILQIRIISTDLNLRQVEMEECMEQ